MNLYQDYMKKWNPKAEENSIFSIKPVS